MCIRDSIGGGRLQVADLKLYMMARWLTSGVLDHISTSVLDHCPKLLRLHKAVAEHSGVQGWLARSKG